MELIEANTPFKIHTMNSFGFDIVTLDGQYGTNVNPEVLKIGFSESEFVPVVQKDMGITN